MATNSFLTLTESIMEEILSWNPSYATHLGVHKYDHLLPDPSPESYEHQTKRLGEFIEMMQGTSECTMASEEILDRDLAVHLFELRLHEILALRHHERMSLVADEIGSSLFYLFAREHLKIEDRIERIASRLEKVPRFAQDSMRCLISPYRLWNEVSLQTGAAFPSFLRVIEGMAAEKLGDCDLTKRLTVASAKAEKSLEEYDRWLKEQVMPKAVDRYSVSREAFDRYMELKQLGVTAEQALEIGQESIKVINRMKADLARRIVPSGDVHEAMEKVKADHPTNFEGVLKAYRDSIRASREFVIEHEIATMPIGEKLVVIETPEFMRHTTPFAAQIEPGKFTTDKTGLFLVTPDDSNPALLKEHSYRGIANTSVHEGYPGHHLQGICGNENPSCVRVLSGATDFAEGWALYCEDMMLSLGYNDTPEGRLVQLIDLKFRVARVVAEVKLSRGEMTVDDVADMLVRECCMEERAAHNEAVCYAYSPTYYMSYYLGKLKLMQLKDDVEKAMGREFSLRFFHDTMLYAGCLPIDFMRRVLAIKLREDYGIELGPASEPFYEYSMRRIRAGLV